MKSSLNEIAISPYETHHIFENRPLYSTRFQSVLKYHLPGLAPAKDLTGAFHITLEGNPAYQERFKQTFGFYCSYAAVETDTGWCHIAADGKPIYKDRYAWCGNYQENLCPVRDSQGNYFHIDLQGARIYPVNYRYAGDFKDGIAVVCHENGKSSHINTHGALIHSNWYHQLDVFHKGFARAKDEEGWFHLTKEGVPAYTHRFIDIEPFYNGQAHAQTRGGALVIINETGDVIREVSSSQNDFMSELSNDLVGFWKSETIKLAVDLGLLDGLPATTDEIAERCHIPSTNMQRVMRALGEVGLVERANEVWVLTNKGQLLTPTNKSFMAAASQMWSKVQNEWSYLKEKLLSTDVRHHPTFKEETTSQKELEIYRRALEGYAQRDFVEVSKWSSWSQHSSIVAFGQTGITLLHEIIKEHSSIYGILAHENRPLYHFDIAPLLQNRLTQVLIEYDKEWPIKAEAALMPRFLHYFPDKDVLSLLEKTNRILPNSGLLYLFEMVLDPHSASGGLLDLNMLAESGGGLRTFNQWETLLAKAGFSIKKSQSIKPYLYLIQGCKQ